MSCKKIKVGHLACAVAMGVVSLSPSAVRAQGDDMTKGADSAGTGTGMTMSTTQPTLVTGTVLRYYVDRSGYVTAMDVQTAEGVQFVRFSPGMGQRLYTTYPVGGQTSVYVMGSPAMGMTRYDVVGMGATMPAPGTMMMPYTVSDVDLLEAHPYIMTGAKQVTVEGRLRDIIVNDRGEVVGLVIGGGNKLNRMMGMGMNTAMDTSMGTAGMGTTGAGGTTSTTSSSTTTTGTPTDMTTTTTTTTDTTTVTGGAMSGGMMMGGSMMGEMGNAVLVRVPREVRHIAPGYAGTDRVTPLFRGANVEVTGYVEAPRYGTLSLYGNRIAANAIVVNGRAVGALGVPMMSRTMTRSLFNNVDLGGASKSAEEMRAAGMGYTVYGTSTGTSTSMGAEPAMTTPDGTMTR